MIEVRRNQNGMMYAIGDRRTGRTSAMVEWLLSAPLDETRVLVCAHERECHRVRGLPELKDIRSNMRIVPMSTLKNGRLLGLRNPVYAFDNLEIILSSLVGGSRIGALSFDR
jgi:hypothetical protein